MAVHGLDVALALLRVAALIFSSAALKLADPVQRYYPFGMAAIALLWQVVFLTAEVVAHVICFITGTRPVPGDPGLCVLLLLVNDWFMAAACYGSALATLTVTAELHIRGQVHHWKDIHTSFFSLTLAAGLSATAAALCALRIAKRGPLNFPHLRLGA